jgi:hypothetical protein
LLKRRVNEAEHIGLSEIQDKAELIDIAFDMHEKGSTWDEIARALHKEQYASPLSPLGPCSAKNILLY